uniref:B box-type domain-containing protein n=1 Tax=Tetraselmis sp. GSL018 TaxID=582737 RepID=A0A061SCM2_9CHLO
MLETEVNKGIERYVTTNNGDDDDGVDECQLCKDNLPDYYCEDCKSNICEDCHENPPENSSHLSSHKVVEFS